MIFPMSPTEYDPHSRKERPSLFSRPGTMMWGLVFAIALLGFASWQMWLVAGALAIVLLLVDRWSRWRRRRAVTPEAAAEAMSRKRA